MGRAGRSIPVLLLVNAGKERGDEKTYIGFPIGVGCLRGELCDESLDPSLAGEAEVVGAVFWGLA